jgi:hypothetical protein
LVEEHLNEFLATNPQEVRNRLTIVMGFYDYQIHTLKQGYADPHPGNFDATSLNLWGNRMY